MPYPAQIDRLAILERARELLEAEGADAVSMHRLAAELGVKPPSLYRHVANRAEMLRAINLDTVERLVAALTGAVGLSDDPRQRVLRMAHAYRDFARANPRAYALAFADVPADQRPDPAQLELLALPLQDVMGTFAGEHDALTALRGIWALIHGFVLLELNGQFRRGGSLEAVFERAVNTYLDGWAC